MTKNVNVAWDLPTTRESGLPLEVDEILHVEVFLSADLGQTFTPINNIEPPTTEITVPDLDVGDWIFRLVVVDVDGRRSTNVDVNVNVPDETAPGGVINVRVSFV